MYKNLCTDGLGVSMRQNELIEIALTYGYKGIEIDMADMAARADSMGKPFATQFVNSANVEVGTFGLPCNLGDSDEGFANQEKRLDLICELAQTIDAKRCYLTIAPDHHELPYHENFEKHRTRIAIIADKLAEIDVVCGLKLNAGGAKGKGMQFIHKADELLALVKTVDHANMGIVFDTCDWLVGQFTADQMATLDLDKVTEVRLADPPENFDAGSEPLQRLSPGSHPNSICQEAVKWLQDKEYAGPVALNAHIPISSSNPGESLFQRISKVYEGLLAGQLPAAPEVVAEEVASEENSEPLSTATQ